MSYERLKNKAAEWWGEWVGENQVCFYLNRLQIKFFFE